MEKDNLEKFITDNREDFDTEVPSPMVWVQMEKELDASSTPAEKKTTKMFSLRRILSIASMFLIVLSAGLLIGMQVTSNNAPVSSDLQEFYDAEAHYTKEVNSMWQTVKNTGIPSENIEQDLNQLDAIYNELKAELMDNPNANSEIVINAMIKNYKAKTEILETVLDRYQSNTKENKVDPLESTKEIY